MPSSIEWKRESKPIAYPMAMKIMEKRVADIVAGTAQELAWLLEHPPLYTAGTSAKESDLVDKDRFPVYHTGRGGQFTYHGPGQRVAYFMLDLTKRYNGEPDLRHYIHDLENLIIKSLHEFDVKGERREGRVGIWVVGKDGKEEKVAAIGVRIRRWVAYHGIAINVNPDLSHFEGIVPCGIKEYGVTSLAKLGKKTDMDALDKALRRNFEVIFRRPD